MPAGGAAPGAARQLVLIVDDEPDLVRLLEFSLQQAGFETASAADGERALVRVQERVPDLVLLDLMLPGIPGTEVCRQIRNHPRTQRVPVIMLTARGDEVERVVGFELGADDFVTKPFSVRELLLRIRAILRRGSPVEEAREAVGPIRLEPDSHRAFVDGEEISLTLLEFRLLSTFLSRAGRVQTREQLLREVWGMSGELQTRTVDTHVKRLREKLGSGRDLLETVRGIGYRLIDPADP
jgi:two-component system phosphate regulon response regulator PhoB